MSARRPAVRTFDPKPGDVGSVLVWGGYGPGMEDDTKRIGEVWSAGPGTGTRWAVCADGSLALLKVGMSGRAKGSVTELVRRPPGWQRTMVRALDRLSRDALAVSEHEEWVDVPESVRGGYLRKWTRYHLTGCEHAERPPVWRELAVRHDDGTVTSIDRATGWHRWLLAHLAARSGHGIDYLDLCECITGERAENAAA